MVVESGGLDEAPTITNPSLWFTNVGGPMGYNLPITSSPRLNNRKLTMALGHVLAGGSSINAHSRTGNKCGQPCDRRSRSATDSALKGGSRNEKRCDHRRR